MLKVPETLRPTHSYHVVPQRFSTKCKYLVGFSAFLCISHVFPATIITQLFQVDIIHHHSMTLLDSLGLFPFESSEGDGGARLRGNSMGELWDVSGTWRGSCQDLGGSIVMGVPQNRSK